MTKGFKISESLQNVVTIFAILSTLPHSRVRTCSGRIPWGVYRLVILPHVAIRLTPSLAHIQIRDTEVKKLASLEKILNWQRLECLHQSKELPSLTNTKPTTDYHLIKVIKYCALFNWLCAAVFFIIFKLPNFNNLPIQSVFYVWV